MAYKPPSIPRAAPRAKPPRPPRPAATPRPKAGVIGKALQDRNELYQILQKGKRR